MRLGSILLKLSKKMSRKGLYEFLAGELLNVKCNSKVLNIGSGGDIGLLVAKFAKLNGFEVVTMDIDQARLPDIVADICFIKYQDEFDYIILSEVLEHVKYPHSAIDNLYASLKKQGTLILTVPFIFPIHDRPNDYFRYTKYGLEMMLSKFNKVKIDERLGWAETFSVLASRFVREGEGRPFFTTFLVIFSFVLFPIFSILSKLYKSDFITTCYCVVAKK